MAAKSSERNNRVIDHDQDGSMELKGTVTYNHNQQSLPFLGRWTPEEDGTVVQYFEQADPESGEMTPIFSAIYRRKAQ